MNACKHLIPFLSLAVALVIGLHVGSIGADAPAAFAQERLQPDEEFDLYFGNDPLNAKFIAKAKVEAYHSNPKELAKERLEAALFEHESRIKEFLAGRGTLEFVIGSSLRRLDAELALCESEADRIAAMEDHWLRMKLVEQVNKARFDAGRIPIQDFMQSRYFRLDAEIALHRARSKQEKK
jgi:hypothetical protein